ncbi:unnamed protein product [Fusarium graminearum]|uniref:Chromosome 1, complete genome n=2 Tax=Gibberella zeae TaxID=5518 RepID=A0A0E0RN88_GIBZE|nr:hypothetical protein FG05_30045 [Fusarium graminearum]CAF3514815.1 unnamed protein product [Fusarium graminearum]CAF3583480.1 unnamed protein product [Fusarium graminearum]CAG1980783.1 unnamed protein product [Fusarium graminearum]CAG2004991.1 unnamed protein product [Fusarium graminearum]
MSATGDVRSEDGSAGTLAQTPDLAAATEVALEPAEGADSGYGAQAVHMFGLDYMSKRSVSGIARKETLSARQSASVIEQNVDFDDVR